MRTQQWGRGPLVFGVGLLNKVHLSKERAEGVMAVSFAKKLYATGIQYTL